ncbi:unnamed protein product [marine sediment metagenome]|uniref:Uncharacterized protein n=1 Tax=marine sediment metagenome TaxID=412755 RepID=X1L137_9ZZZZ
MARIFVAPLIGKGDSIDDPIRPAVKGNFAMASNPSRDLKKALVLSEKKPKGANEAKDKDFEDFGVRKGWIKLKEK